MPGTFWANEKAQQLIGLRIALGASRGQVIGIVLREAVLLPAIGLAVGTGLAVWAGQAAGLLASPGPARSASRLQPMDALRDE